MVTGEREREPLGVRQQQNGSRTEQIRSYYDPKIDDGLEGACLLGWENEEAQNLRFGVLLEHGKPSGKTLLDVGCGTADLWHFLSEKGVDVSYSGVDISKRMIQYARERFSDINVMERDIFNGPGFPAGAFDLIYASGIFNLNLGNNLDFFIRAMDRFFSIAGETIVFNMLHVRSPEREDDTYYYYDPSLVLSIVRQYPCSAYVIDDYLPNDFSVVCRKISP